MTQAAQTPSLVLGRVALTVNDLPKLRDFYEKIVGLHLLRGDGDSAELGVGGETLLELRSDPAAHRASPREAGLFHTAFLLPSRAALGEWIKHAAESRAPVTGASDHDVSEALYLRDPEGNGVEIYADRPAETWVWTKGEVFMRTYPLDAQAVIAEAGDGPWRGFQEGSRVGHVHLQAGDLPPAEAFWTKAMGLDLTNRYQGALFYSADGYHHHIATNVWNSQGAQRRVYPSTGLADFEIRLAPARLEAARKLASDARTVTDPWTTKILISAL